MKSILIVACSMVLIAGFAVEAAKSNTFRQTPGASATKKARVLDLTPMIEGKVFADGTHPLQTLENGELISIVTERNRILEVVHTLANGRQTSKRVRAVRLPSQCSDDDPNPRGGTHLECDDDCSTGGPKGQETIVCHEVPDAPPPGPGDHGGSDPQPPVITSFAPSAGPVGTGVRITGTNFVQVKAVTFRGRLGGVSARILESSRASLTVIVPAGAITGPITVVTSTAGSAASKNSFTVK